MKTADELCERILVEDRQLGGWQLAVDVRQAIESRDKIIAELRKLAKLRKVSRERF